MRCEVAPQGKNGLPVTASLIKQWREGIGYLIRFVFLALGMEIMAGVAFAPLYLMHLIYESWQSSLALGWEITLIVIMSGYGLLVAPVVLYWIVQMTDFYHEEKNSSSPGKNGGSIEGQV